MKENVHTLKRRGFRLWKSGKHWFTAGAVATSLIVVSSQSSASADEVTPSNTDTSSSFVIGTETTTVENNANGGTTTTVTSPTTVVESPVTTTTTNTVSSSATVTTESGVPVTESTVKNDTETGIAATNLDKKASDDSADKSAYNTNENSVKGEGDVTIDHSTLENSAKDAQSKGVEVIKDADVKAPTTSNADETAKIVNSVTDAESKKANELNSTASKYAEDKTAWEKVKAETIAFNEGVSQASNSAEEAYKNFVSTLDADTAAVVSKYKDAIIVKTEEVVSSGDGTSVDAYQNYIRVLAEKEKLNKDRISEYLVKRTNFDVDVQKIKDVNERNKQLSQSADAENTRRSQSVVSHNESAKASAEAENTKRSQEAKQSSDDEAKKSTEVAEYNKSVTASAEAENTRLSQSAAAENAKINSNKEALESANAEAQAYNKKVMESRGLTYTGDYAKDKATVDNYNANLSAYTVISESNSSAWDAAVNNASDTLPAASNGYTPSGSSTFTKPVTLANGVQVVGAGVLTSDGSSVLFKGDNVDESKIVNSVNWGNTALEPVDGGSVRTLTPKDNNDIWGNTYDYTTGGSSRYYVVQTLKWYKIAGLITTMDGVSHDGYIMFHSDPSGLHPAYDGSEVAVWNSNGAINVVDGAATGSANAKSDAIRTVISMDKPNNDDKSITWVSLMSDIDGGQYLDGDAGKVIGVGGGLATNSVTDKVASDENLGFTYGKNTSSNALNGFDSAPDGTVLLVQNGLYSNSLRNTPGGNSNAVARADFGSRSSVSKTIIKTETPTPISIKPISTDDTNPVTYTPVTPELKTYTPGTPTPYTPVTPELKTYTPGTPTPYTPVNPDLVEYVPVTFELEKVPENPTQPQLQLTTVNKPVEPKTKELPKEPVRPTVHYNLTTLETTTKVSKSVNNLDGLDINNMSVAKNSKNTFTLSAEPLSAGREKTTSISWSDYINDGLKLDLDTMTKDNTNYKVSFDETTRLLTMVGNDKEVAQANADLTKQYSITKPKITFTTLNDGATYTNTAKMEWNGGSEKGGITSYTNKVVIHTPGKPTNPNNPHNPNGPGNEKIQPVKNNTDKNGKNINDKTLLQNDTNYYVAEWDLDQYINDASSKEAIAKGFGYIDNYQDDALQPVTSDFKIVDSKGNEVKGLTRYDVNSAKISEQPEKVQQLIKDSGIDVSNFGDFFVWVADDSQAFYDTYVKTGTDVFFNLPMKVKEGFVGNYTNQTYQIDFGNGYYGNVVKNNIPNLVPHKDVIVDGKFADGSTVAYGQEFKYLLEGVKIPGNRGDILWQYDFDDDYDQTGDKFLGTYRVSASTNFKTSSEVTLESDTTFKEDVTLSDGTVVKAGQTVAKGSKVKVDKEYKVGDDLTDFTTMTHDEANGIVKITFKEDFLKSVTADSEFGANASLDVKRIAYGEFENTYFNTVNGVKYKSNTVRTNTPKPKDPTPPTPDTPKPPTPVTPENPTPVTPETPKPVNNPKEVLPDTGESNSSAVAALGLGLLLASGGVMVAKRKGKEEK